MAPLLSYVECQRWLAAHHPSGSDLDGAGGVEAFAAALQHHVVFRCLASTAGPTDGLANARLGYK